MKKVEIMNRLTSVKNPNIFFEYMSQLLILGYEAIAVFNTGVFASYSNNKSEHSGAVVFKSKNGKFTIIICHPTQEKVYELYLSKDPSGFLNEITTKANSTILASYSKEEQDKVLIKAKELFKIRA